MVNNKDIKKIKIGKGFTIEQIEQLASAKWCYSLLVPPLVLEHVPREDEDELMHGAVDLHVHAYPDVIQRISMIDICKEASRQGMEALVFKSMRTLNAGEAWLVEQFLKEWKTGKDEDIKLPRIYGSVVLNEPVGGLNPKMVRAAVNYPNCKAIWMPTYDAAHHRKTVGQEGGISLLDENGKLRKEVLEIVEIVSKAREKIFIGSGHISFEELYELVKICKDANVDVVVDHVTEELTRLTIDEMKELANMGAYLGLYAITCVPNVYLPIIDPTEAPRLVKEIGPEHFVISSDYGQYLSIDPVNGLRLFIRTLLAFKIKKEDLEIMVKKNPKKILGLPQ
jgi:hypothetical protein